MSNLLILKDYLFRFLQNPIDFLILLINKIFIYPFIYKNGNDYDAKKYWENRFKKHKLGIKGPGQEGATVFENELRYKRVTEIFISNCKKHISNIETLNVLEIGVGTGLITDALCKLGVTRYLGIDITNVLFIDIQKKFPHYKFLKTDVTTDIIDGKFDVVVIIDVIEHIVTTEKLDFAFSNLNNCLNDNGYILIAPITNQTKKSQFYEHYWTLNDLKPISNYQIIESVEWTKNFSNFIIKRKY